MKMSVQTAIASLLIAVATVAAEPAAAQAYPSRPVKIIVPYGVGSAPDVIARLVAEELAPRLGQPFVVENRLGAGGKLGTELAARASADGYTLLLGSKDTHGVMAHLYPNWDVRPLRDLAPISLLMRIQNALVANKDLKAANAQELIALARMQNLNYGTPGVGTNLHLAGELFRQDNNLQLTHVPYKTLSQILPALARGELQLAVLGVPPVTPWVRDGRIKAIAVTGKARSPFLPDAPTFVEQGVSGHESGGWFALFAPSATPADIQKRLNAEVMEIGKLPSYRERVARMFAEPYTSTREELAALAGEESARWGAVVRKAGVRLE